MDRHVVKKVIDLVFEGLIPFDQKLHFKVFRFVVIQLYGVTLDGSIKGKARPVSEVYIL